MSCPPQHITSMAIDANGWIIDALCQGDGAPHQSPLLIPSCEQLLNETNLDLSSDVFEGDGGARGREPDVPSEGLAYRPKLNKDMLSKVISSIRRLGEPSDRDKGAKAEKEKGRGGGSRQRRGQRRENRGKVAQLEEQRRLRQQQEQEKAEQARQSSEIAEEDEEAKASHLIGEKEEAEPAPPAEIPVGQKLAAVFNSLRVLITILRPMIDHPQSKDAEIKMKDGPSIKSQGKASRFYLISKHVYSLVSIGSWNEVRREYAQLLDEMQHGLSASMSKKLDNGQYELNPKDWVASLFNHELYTDQELVAEKCMGILNPNPEVASKLHDAIIHRFENDHAEKQLVLKWCIDNLQDKLASAIARRFGGARLTVYGSCLSGLALEGSHDVDISIYIPELDNMKKSFDNGVVSAEQYEKRMRRIIFSVRDALQYRREFSDLFAVTRARVPVIKGAIITKNPYTADGSLSFDLCFLNDIAVVNSELLREYSLFGHVRILMLSVKSFAKRNGIASAADSTLSSYSWNNMVVFFLQCIGMLPVLQCPILMHDHDFEHDPTDRWHCIGGLKTSFLTKDMVAKRNIWQQSTKINDVAMLLFGFFNFYSNIFPQLTVAASIRYGKMSLNKTSFPKTSRSWRLCMEDAFETCDSHCPHDLGCHVNEDGQKKISASLKWATIELGRLMQQPIASGDTISEFLCVLLDSTPKPNGYNQRGAARNNQLPQNSPHQARGNGERNNNRGNKGVRGNNSNNTQYRSRGRAPAQNDQNRSAKGSSQTDTMQIGSREKPPQNTSARSQMSKNDNAQVSTQKNHGRKDQNRTINHGNADSNATRSSKQILQPKTDGKFVAKQKEGLLQTSEEKKHKVSPKQKKASRNDNVSLADKVGKSLNAKRD